MRPTEPVNRAPPPVSSHGSIVVTALGVHTESPADMVDVLCELMDRRAGGELRGGAPGLHAMVCAYEGQIAFARSETHPQHLGDVLARQCGLGLADLRDALAYCRANGLRLGEGLVRLGLVSLVELRHCLRLHVARHLLHALRSARETTEWAWQVQHYRYNPNLLYDLDDLLTDALLEVCTAGFPGMWSASLRNFDTEEELARVGDAVAETELLDFGRAAREIDGRFGVTAQYVTTERGMFFAHRIPWDEDQFLLIHADERARPLGHFMKHARGLLGS